ncbi:hypothetical protein LCGC14_0942340 [marine sediment metagenome]|uniref:Uncharacterized protein n=1 Tax=marine sediment metagenome TaxID=412755 RepID=A0A0F9NJU6_9ZZZZ
MIRLNSTVSLMVATEEQAGVLEAALRAGPVVLGTPSEFREDSFSVVVIAEVEPEEHLNKAVRILG